MPYFSSSAGCWKKRVWGAFNKLKKLHHSLFLISAIPVTPHISDRMSIFRGRACWQPLYVALWSGSPACLHAYSYQHTFAMQHSQAVQGGKGTLAPGLHTNVCFHLKGVKMPMSAHDIFHRIQCLYLGRTRNQSVLFWPNIGNLYMLRLLKMILSTDGKHVFFSLNTDLFKRTPRLPDSVSVCSYCMQHTGVLISSLWKCPFVYCAPMICIRN